VSPLTVSYQSSPAHAPLSRNTTPTSPSARHGDTLAALLTSRLAAETSRLAAQFGTRAEGRVRCCWLDDVLPVAALEAANAGLPPLAAMLRRADEGERKYVCADLDGMGPPLRELIGAFARQPVADAVAAIMGMERLETDERLYNGGLTVMLPGDFMRPHLDNSHDYDRRRRRHVVLLFYLSPDWGSEYGGHLQLWPLTTRGAPETVPFRPNRLVIMETGEHSWHSVQPIIGPVPRNSLTTYFYAPASEHAPLRVTRFTGWPGEPIRSLWFSGRFHLRNAAARAVGRCLVRNRHAYRPRSDHPRSQTAQGARNELPGCNESGTP